MLNALDTHLQNHRQVKLVVETDITARKQPGAPRARVQPSESISTLIGDVAHDFNNVLNSILMSASLLQMGRPEQEQHHLLRVIQASAERGAAMVKGLLALADQADGPTDPCLERFLRAG